MAQTPPSERCPDCLRQTRSNIPLATVTSSHNPDLRYWQSALGIHSLTRVLFRTVAGNSVSFSCLLNATMREELMGGMRKEIWGNHTSSPPVHMDACARTHSVEGAEKHISGFLTPDFSRKSTDAFFSPSHHGSNLQLISLLF